MIPASQESASGAVHPESTQLALHNPKHKNDSRDFWNFHDIPVAAWLGAQWHDQEDAHDDLLQVERLGF